MYNHPMSLNNLLKSNKTIFTVNDLQTLLAIDSKAYLKTVIFRLVKMGVLARIVKGVYTTKNTWNKMEFANRLRSPSYVSFESILCQSGVIFQDFSNTITSAYKNTIQKDVNDISYKYYKLETSLLTNPLGIVNTNGITCATPERAVCDRIYLTPDYYFDNIDTVNKELLVQVSKIYNKRVQKEVEQLCL